MTQDWVLLQTEDLRRVLSPAVLSSTTVPNDTGDTLMEQALAMVISRVRSSVASSGRVPLSLSKGPVSSKNKTMTVQAVPPQAEQHTLILTADLLMASVPTMADYASSPSWKRQVECAEKWLDEEAKAGLGVSYPSDPDDNTVPFPAAVLAFSDNNAQDDLSTDGAPISIVISDNTLDGGGA